MTTDSRVMTPHGPGRVVDVVTSRHWSAVAMRMNPVHTIVVELDQGQPRRRNYTPRQVTELKAVAA